MCVIYRRLQEAAVCVSGHTREAYIYIFSLDYI